MAGLVQHCEEEEEEASEQWLRKGSSVRVRRKRRPSVNMRKWQRTLIRVLFFIFEWAFFVENFVHFVFVGPKLVIVWANFCCSYFEFLISCLRGLKAIFGGHDYFCD